MESQQKTVLIVDDVADVRIHIQRLLMRRNTQIISCQDGSEALEAISKTPCIDLILLDLSMPGMDGWGLLSALEKLKQTRSFKVCVLSGHSDMATINQISRFAVDDFLTKPFDKEIFLNRISSLLGDDKFYKTPFAFAQVRFPATVINLPIRAEFYIVGLTEEGVFIESAVQYRDGSVLAFECPMLCDSIGVIQQFHMNVLRTQSNQEKKFLMCAVFFGLSQAVNAKIRLFSMRHAKQSASVW